MNEQKVREEIVKLTANHPYRQYPLNKAQRARLEELGLLPLMPERFLGSGQYGPGNLDAKVVLAAAEDAGGVAGGVTAWGEGEMVHSTASALYKALHGCPSESDPVPPTDDDEDDPIEVEVAEYDFDDQVYIVYKRGDEYFIDAEWADGPAAVFSRMPSEDEVREVHTSWLEAVREQDILSAAEAEYAEAEQRRFEAQQALLVERELAEEARANELRPLKHFAHLVKPDTLRRAALEGRLGAEKFGRDWFTSELEVRRYLARRGSRRQRDAGSPI